MKFLKNLIFVIIVLVVILLLVGGYFGLVPGVSSLFGSDKARDLGVVATTDLSAVANTKLAVQRVGDAKVAEKIVYSGSHPVNISLSPEEISSLVTKGEWRYNPIADDFQVKINADGSTEVSGLLDRARLDGYLTTNGFKEVLTYTSKFNFLPAKVPFYLNGSLKIVNNKVDMNLTSAEVGRTPLPTDSGAVGAVERFVERRMSAVSGLSVTSLDFTGAKMNFKGTFPSKMTF